MSTYLQTKTYSVGLSQFSIISMPRTFFCIIIFSTWVACVFGQSLPSQWTISEDGKFLVAGNKPSAGLYDETVLEEIRLYFPQSNYWALMTENYLTSTDIPAKLVYKGRELDSVGVRFKGQTSYFANNSQKKSFNISVDAFRDDQRLDGYKTLNLNNAFQDATFMREVLYYHLIRPHTPAAKANFVKLYLNDQYWGIYLNVQQLNKDFLKEWYESNDGNNFRADKPETTFPGGGGGGGGAQWGDGTAAINYLGTDTTEYQKYYTLKSSGYQNPWSELVHACDVLNNSGNALEMTFPEVFDLDKILWHLASEIAFTDDDSYVYKGKMDYYLYQDDITGRWATYDYDANSVMSNNSTRINWSPFYNETKPNYPLLNKVLSIPAFRQRYLAHLRTILLTAFDEVKANLVIDQYDALIREHVFADTKKTTTNQAYTNGLAGLKTFISNRKNFLANHADVKKELPVITESKYSCKGVDFGKVTRDDAVFISAKATYPSGISELNAWVSTAFTGTFMKISMNDAGQNGDLYPGDGIFSLALPTYNPGTMVRFYLEAVANDAVKTRVYEPAKAEQHVFFFRVENTYSGPDRIAINECMASNSGIITDEAGEAEDWIELYNLTSSDINMSGFTLSDKIDNPTKFAFAEGTVIPANGYLIVWADEDKSQGPLHANFKLSADGEGIYLYDNSQQLLDSVTFGIQTEDKSLARIPNGTGPWVVGDHTFNKNNESATALDDEHENASLRIYPNPARGLINIENNDPVSARYTIYNTLGIEMKHIELPALSTTMVTDLPQGIYFLSDGKQTIKFIILP